MASWTYSPTGVDEPAGVAPMGVMVKFSSSGLWLSATVRAVSPMSN